jgi:hypothetical protein
MLSLLPYESIETGPLPRDLLKPYVVAVEIVGVADSLATCRDLPDRDLWLLSKSLQELEIRGDVFKLLTGKAQELNSVRDRPVRYWNIAYPNAHLVTYELWDRLLANAWLLADSLNLVPGQCCADRFDFDLFHLSVLEGKGREIRDHFSVHPIPRPTSLVAELSLEVSRVARQRARQSDRTDSVVRDDDSSFRPAKEFLDGSAVTSHKRLAGILKRNPWIRTRKPSKQRLEVHAGDWMRFRSTVGSAAFEVLDASGETIEEFLAAARERREQIRQRKAAK